MSEITRDLIQKAQEHHDINAVIEADEHEQPPPEDAPLAELGKAIYELEGEGVDIGNIVDRYRGDGLTPALASNARLFYLSLNGERE
ncbi:hypothetical protein GCM10027040_27090 [Halomonas shantousis]